MVANRPTPEIDVTVSLARKLVEEQFPDWSDLALTELDRGWDNTSFRLGDDLVVRIPHRALAAPLIGHEQRWLPEIAERVDLAIPAPVGAGRPSERLGYPWCWSVVPWFEGADAAVAPLRDPAVAARRLGTFFRQLHVPAPEHAPSNPFRGGRIADFSHRLDHHLSALGDAVDGPRCRELFEWAAAAPPASAPVWLHGDLHARNVVVHEGSLAAVIDWGDLCSGDRATDLAGAFMLVPDHIGIVAEAAGSDEASWVRARGWATLFALVYLANSADEPVMASIGNRLLAALVDGLE